MTEFEMISLTYSFVLGLGIAQILSAASAALGASQRMGER